MKKPHGRADNSGVPRKLEKIPPDESVQKPVRVPGHLWNRIVDAMEWEGATNYSEFALQALTSRVREAELRMRQHPRGKEG